MFAESYAQYYDLFNQDKPYKKEINFIYKWAKKPKSIFDIGVGTGTYWKYYPKEVDICGIDKSISMANQSNDVVCADITKYKHTKERFDCATALFDVINYIPKHDWWKNIPIKKDGYFIFDIFDKEKVLKEGFRQTFKKVGSAFRTITPIRLDKKSVELKIQVFDRSLYFQEIHKMYLYSQKDIEIFCGKEFKIVAIEPTKRWQRWYKCQRR